MYFNNVVYIKTLKFTLHSMFLSEPNCNFITLRLNQIVYIITAASEHARSRTSVQHNRPAAADDGADHAATATSLQPSAVQPPASNKPPHRQHKRLVLLLRCL